MASKVRMAHRFDLGRLGQQNNPSTWVIAPHGCIPAIVDRDADSFVRAERDPNLPRGWNRQAIAG